MDELSDPASVRAQYRTTGNLSARQSLHDRFSVNEWDWHAWVYSKLDLPRDSRVLDIGCGTGELWSRAPRGVTGDLILSDASAAMLGRARESVQRARFVRAAVQDLPFGEGRFDCVIANHMLYHVPEVAPAIAQIRRVLRSGGKLVAATNGPRHLDQLWKLLVELGGPPQPTRLNFDLECGPDLLAAAFDDVQVQRFDDHLAVTEVQPLVDYVRSLDAIPDGVIAAVAARAGERIRRDGAFVITKDAGLLIAS